MDLARQPVTRSRRGDGSVRAPLPLRLCVNGGRRWFIDFKNRTQARMNEFAQAFVTAMALIGSIGSEMLTVN